MSRVRGSIESYPPLDTLGIDAELCRDVGGHQALLQHGVTQSLIRHGSSLPASWDVLMLVKTSQDVQACGDVVLVRARSLVHISQSPMVGATSTKGVSYASASYQ